MKLTRQAPQPRRKNARAFDNGYCPFAPSGAGILANEGRSFCTTPFALFQAKTWSNINIYWGFLRKSGGFVNPRANARGSDLFLSHRDGWSPSRPSTTQPSASECAGSPHRLQAPPHGPLRKQKQSTYTTPRRTRRLDVHELCFLRAIRPRRRA